MTRDQINRYERECVNRAGVFLNRRNRGDDAAMKVLAFIEYANEKQRERRKARQKEGEMVCD